MTLALSFCGLYGEIKAMSSFVGGRLRARVRFLGVLFSKGFRKNINGPVAIYVYGVPFWLCVLVFAGSCFDFDALH